MHETAAAEAWRYLQAMGCTRTFYDVHQHSTTTHFVAIAQASHIIATGSDTSDRLANVTLLEAVRVAARAPLSGATPPGLNAEGDLQRHDVP